MEDGEIKLKDRRALLGREWMCGGKSEKSLIDRVPGWLPYQSTTKLFQKLERQPLLQFRERAFVTSTFHSFPIQLREPILFI